MRSGALLFLLTFRLFSHPPNFFSPEDILWGVWPPSSFGRSSGNLWINPFTYSKSELGRLRSFRRAQRKTGSGRPPKPPSWPEKDEESLVARYFHESLKFPDFSRVLHRLTLEDKILPQYAKKTDRRHAQWLSARRVQRTLWKGAFAHRLRRTSSSPRRHPLFLNHLDTALTSQPKHQPYHNLVKWWVTFLLLTGCRPHEALNVKRSHLDDHASPRVMRIPGTKTHAAARTLDLVFLADDAVGKALKLGSTVFRNFKTLPYLATFDPSHLNSRP